MDKNKNFLLEEDEEEDIIEQKPKTKKPLTFGKKIMILSFALTIISGLIFGFALFWQARTDLWAISNAFGLVTVLLFFLAWIFFVYNRNILSPMIHGFKTFGLMFVGRRPREDYFEYTQRIYANPIPKYIYNTMFIFSFIFLIPTIITIIMIG